MTDRCTGDYTWGSQFAVEERRSARARHDPDLADDPADRTAEGHISEASNMIWERSPLREATFKPKPVQTGAVDPLEIERMIGEGGRQ